MSKFTFDKSKASRIAVAIGDCLDKGGHVSAMKDRLAAEFKGLPRKALDDTQAAMVRDAIEANLKARKTISEQSVGPMTSTAAKVARFMPIMLGMEAKAFAPYADNYERIAKFATALKRADGVVATAVAEMNAKAARKNYPKAAASHIRALLGMKEGKFLTAEAKALLVAFSDAVKLPVGELADEARSIPKAKKAFAAVA